MMRIARSEYDRLAFPFPCATQVRNCGLCESSIRPDQACEGTIIASFDIASLLMWRTSRHLSGHAFGGCIARVQPVSRRSSSSGLPPRPGDGLCHEHTGLLSWPLAWFSVPIRVASSQCQQGSSAEGKSAHRNAQPTRSHGATQVRDGSRPESAQGVLRPRVWRLVGAMSELSKAGQCPIANDVEPLQTRD
jgi:hypothetical protein